MKPKKDLLNFQWYFVWRQKFPLIHIFSEQSTQFQYLWWPGKLMSTFPPANPFFSFTKKKFYTAKLNYFFGPLLLIDTTDNLDISSGEGSSVNVVGL